MYAAMQAAVDLNPRYKPANIMSVELDMPDRTTMDYEGPAMDARVQVWGLEICRCSGTFFHRRDT